MISKTSLIKVYFLFFLSFLVFTEELGARNPDANGDSTAIMQLYISAKQKMLKNFPEALKDINQAIEKAEKLNNKLLLFRVYRKKAFICEENSRIEEAGQNYQRCLELSDYVNDTSKLEINYDWAIINRKLNHYKVSRDYFNRTLDLAQKIKDLEMVEFAYNGLGTLHEFLGEFDLAIAAYLKSIEFAEKGNRKKNIAISLSNISDVYLKGKNVDLAFENAQKAYNMAISINDSSKIALSNNTLGKALNAKGRHNDALNYHNRALQIYEELNDKTRTLTTLIYISEVYAQKGDYNEAKQYLLKCLKYKENSSFYDLANLYLKLGNLYHKTNDATKAIEMLQLSIKVAKEWGLKDIIQKSSFILSQVYQQNGNYQLAYASLQTANVYGDSIFNVEKSQRLAEAQYKFDVEKAEAQYTYEKELSEKRIQDIEIKQSRYLLTAILVIFFTVIGTLIYIVKMKSKSNFVLLQKNKEIKFQNERLEKSNEILSQFAYASAHDLKEPLRSISSFVHIIEKKYVSQLPPEASEYMKFVVGGVKRMESLLGALLEYSTVASEQQEVKKTTPISQVLSDVQDNLRSTITEKNALIDISGALPSLWISRLHLTQLFQNLLSNAMKFTDKQPQISIKGKIKGEEWLITVSDNGIGMKAEYSDKIFRLFQRLSRSPQYEGTGIGLAICKHIVDKYDGKIWFESVENEGTTFFISFPLTVVKFEKEIALNTEGVLIS